MRYATPALVLLAVGLHGLSPVEAQVAQRVARAPDGTIRLSFATRAEVCGDGSFIGEDTPRGFRMYSFRGNGYSMEMLEDVQPECRTGPLRLVVTKVSGRVTDLNAAVGVAWRERSSATDLGLVPAAEAATWLLDLAQNSQEDRVQTVAFVAAAAADSARIAERLFSLARNRTLASGTRAQSLRWLSDAALRENLGSQADGILKAIVRDESDITSVRERAIRELVPGGGNDVFLRDTYRAVSDLALRERIVRALAASRTDQNAAWIRGIALDKTEAVRLRDRAIRALGEDMGRKTDVRALYETLDDPALKDRALRVVVASGDSSAIRWIRTVALDSGEPVQARDRAVRAVAEAGGAAANPWLTTLATDGAQPEALRDRAIRLLGESTSSVDLAALYDRLQTAGLRQRLVRILAERGDDAAIEKLIQIADKEVNPSERRYLLRRLGETRNPKARTFLENKVTR